MEDWDYIVIKRRRMHPEEVVLDLCISCGVYAVVRDNCLKCGLSVQIAQKALEFHKCPGGE